MNANSPERSLFDEDGLLRDPACWSEALAASVADSIGVGTLTLEHWKIIRALRGQFLKAGAAPAMHHVCREAGVERSRVNDLFGYCLNAWRVAGLPNPGEEAKTYLSGM